MVKLLKIDTSKGRVSVIARTPSSPESATARMMESVKRRLMWCVPPDGQLKLLHLWSRKFLHPVTQDEIFI